ncbi:hypothetical protein CC78DRAFT_58812 [Lojkania enalia]|uniref:Nuclear pore complex protein Nup85 n=1 Tax=Lojkania enalia TaxID=147567 RepID=A0A9P4N2B0_9PLEO|nr:hypothetical protein CC78DRAFT_58812 [Didymosphaeria enalia]
MFRAQASSPPSTPDSHRTSRNAPSTTPAGPPPGGSFMPSSTPAGPPPASLFGNSQFNLSNTRPLNFSNSTFGSSPPKTELFGVGSASFGVSTSGRPGSQRGRSGFRVPSSTPSQPEDSEEGDGDEEDGDEEEQDEDMDDEEIEGEGEDEDEDEDEDEEIDEDEEEGSEGEQETISPHGRSQGGSKFSHSIVSRSSTSQQQAYSPSIVRSGAKQSQYDLVNLAKGLAPCTSPAPLQESDDIILETERLMTKLHQSATRDTIEQKTDVLVEVAQELALLWQASSQISSTGSLSTSTQSASISPLAGASRLTHLLLNIHYPPYFNYDNRSSRLSLVSTLADAKHFTPIPKVLLDWLNTYHNTVSEVGMVLRQNRGYSADPAFWDAVHVSALRGNFAATLKLLKGAQFEVADTADQDKLGTEGYRGSHLTHANTAADAAVKLLHECPALVSENWDIKGQDWNIFRRRVQQAANDLQEFAEGDSQNRHNFSHSFQASHFGLSQSQNNFNLSIASRKAESKVPWSVYENLNRLYKLLLGGEAEIIALSSDWIEATIGLAVWWSGEDDDVPQGSLAASRASIARSQRLRPVDITPVQAYCQRLSSALAAVLESEEDFSINTTDSVEVGLACIFDNNIEGILQIIRSWSLSLASAIGEVASNGDWFPRADGILDQFDQSDLMVLSYNEQQPVRFSKDDLLIAYAKTLSTKEKISSSDGTTGREGWELAIQVLGRLNDQRVANERIQALLEDLPLQSTERVDKISQLCFDLGLSHQARAVALKYADHLRHNTHNYGDTLLYYAQAHDGARIQEVLRVLVAHCLVKSIAYPPLAELDDSLHALIASPKQTLTRLARTDPEGAHLLSNCLSGYATIRKFYDLRDEEILVEDGERPAHRPLARKRAAANALMVIIASAASSIRGGLYDPEVETVVQVDVLLNLLGEALVFVNQPKRMLTLKHLYSLLAAVEDIDTAPSMIRNQTEECLHTTLLAAHDGSVPSPRSTLQKSTSNLTTASSQYSLIGSTDLSSDAQSIESSTVLVKGGNVDDAKRAWDWRKGFRKAAKGEDVIRILRLGIAKEIARAFVEGEV